MGTLVEKSSIHIFNDPSVFGTHQIMSLHKALEDHNLKPIPL